MGGDVRTNPGTSGQASSGVDESVTSSTRPRLRDCMQRYQTRRQQEQKQVVAMPALLEVELIHAC